jgi:hypothetical protein
VLAAVKRNGGALKYAADKFKKDRKIVLTAVEQNGLALEYADKFKEDRKIVLAAVKRNGLALKYAADKFKKDREIVLVAVKQDGRVFECADDILKKDKAFIIQLLNVCPSCRGDIFKYVKREKMEFNNNERRMIIKNAKIFNLEQELEKDNIEIKKRFPNFSSVLFNHKENVIKETNNSDIGCDIIINCRC